MVRHHEFPFASPEAWPWPPHRLNALPGLLCPFDALVTHQEVLFQWGEFGFIRDCADDDEPFQVVVGDVPVFGRRSRSLLPKLRPTVPPIAGGSDEYCECTAYDGPGGLEWENQFFEPDSRGRVTHRAYIQEIPVLAFIAVDP